ncbi:MAG: hypothetical protein EHM93_03705 [Bacteroidales bacterium]|nr:MAG: hypothetical protein EHM93_03705 [Bacteroidales bacterium]
METIKTYDRFPSWIVATSNLLSLLIYGLGFAILLLINTLLASIYLAFVLSLEIRIIRNHCINCYYYGKTCGFGKGRISALLFKKGDSSRFCTMKITWKDMIPDMLVVIIPLIVGIILLIKDFDYKILIAIALLLFLATMGNGFVRGTLTCKYCKQREIGCPADKLFNK